MRQIFAGRFSLVFFPGVEKKVELILIKLIFRLGDLIFPTPSLSVICFWKSLEKTR